MAKRAWKIIFRIHAERIGLGERARTSLVLDSVYKE
jgi:hypothetical protein